MIVTLFNHPKSKENFDHITDLFCCVITIIKFVQYLPQDGNNPYYIATHVRSSISLRA